MRADLGLGGVWYLLRMVPDDDSNTSSGGRSPGLINDLMQKILLSHIKACGLIPANLYSTPCYLNTRWLQLSQDSYCVKTTA